MLVAEMNGLKVVHVDISAAHNTAVSLSTASILGGVLPAPELVGAVVLESALGADGTTGAPIKVLGIAAVIDNTTGIISITAQYSDALLTARMIRVALYLKD